MAAGPGYTDANGAYWYGEADDAGSMSDTLNLAAAPLSAALASLDTRLDAVEVAAICQLGKSANQAMSATPVAVTWDVELLDAAGLHHPSTNLSRVTIPAGKGGVYLVAFNGYVNATSGLGVLYARKNGVTGLRGSWTRRDGTAASGTPLSTVCLAPLVAGDYVEMIMSHTGGGTLAGGAATPESTATLTAVRLGVG